jgi:hypothetical protein
MARSSFVRASIAAFAFLLGGGAALAQSPECQRFRAELAALDRNGGGRGNPGQAEATRVEIGRLTNYYRSIGCERGPFSFFSGPPPAECGPVAGRIRQLEGQFARLSAQGDSGIEMRRRQLLAAVQQTCSAEPRGFFESLFGPPRGQPQQPVEGFPEEQIIEAQPQERSLGGSRLVCVKTCDGSYFPLSTSPGGRSGADEMCQALCPGTETRAYGTSGGDEAIKYATSVSGGQPYSALANALKYRRTFDESCACKKDNESWAVVLRRAESMLEQRKGDVIVTAEKAEELSRPKAVAQSKKQQAAEKKTADQAEAEAAAAAAAAPTASTESSGIGPQSIEGERVVGQGEGQKRQLQAAGGAKTVRVIAPELIPVPNPAK